MYIYKIVQIYHQLLLPYLLNNTKKVLECEIPLFAEIANGQQLEKNLV